MDAYSRIKKIGEGAMGSATLVQHVDSQDLFVVKEINVKGLSDKDRREALKEVEVLKKLRHPNIISMHEAFIEGGNLNILMEYADAGDLAQLLHNARGRPFKEERVLDLFVQICLGMHHVHSQNILHRDLKTANILLTRQGIIKLADFGIARVMSSETDMAKTMIGTPYYLSPEICEDRPYNHKSDIWSLGCVLYELLTLRHAFEAKSLSALILKIIRGKFSPVSSSYSREVRSLVDSMLQNSPAARPSIASILTLSFLKGYVSSHTSTWDCLSDKDVEEGGEGQQNEVQIEEENSRRQVSEFEKENGAPARARIPKLDFNGLRGGRSEGNDEKAKKANQAQPRNHVHSDRKWRQSREGEEVRQGETEQQPVKVSARKSLGSHDVNDGRNELQSPSSRMKCNERFSLGGKVNMSPAEWMAEMHARIDRVKDDLQGRRREDVASAQKKKGEEEEEGDGKVFRPPFFLDNYDSDQNVCMSIDFNGEGEDASRMGVPGDKQGPKGRHHFNDDGALLSPQTRSRPPINRALRKRESDQWNFEHHEGGERSGGEEKPASEQGDSACSSGREMRARALAEAERRANLAKKLQNQRIPATGDAGQSDGNRRMSNPSKAPKKGGVGDACGKKEEAKKTSVGVNKGRSNPVLSAEDMKLRQKEHKEKLRAVRSKISLGDSPFSPRNHASKGSGDRVAQEEEKGGREMSEFKQKKGGLKFDVEIASSEIKRTGSEGQKSSNAADASTEEEGGKGKKMSLAEVIRRGREQRKESGTQDVPTEIVCSNVPSQGLRTIEEMRPQDSIDVLCHLPLRLQAYPAIQEPKALGAHRDFQPDEEETTQGEVDEEGRTSPAEPAAAILPVGFAGKTRKTLKDIRHLHSSPELTEMLGGMSVPEEAKEASEGEEKRFPPLVEKEEKEMASSSSLIPSEMIEKMRHNCEQSLGLSLFLDVYHNLRASHDGSNALPGEVLDRLGEERLPMIKEVAKLIQKEEDVYLQH